MRGNQLTLSMVLLSLGSIPASAGEPVHHFHPWWSTRVYPRECGGTAAGTGRMSSNTGLSPRVRGNRNVIVPPTDPERSIPASAGEPQQRLRAPNCWRVYPRECGGTTSGSSGHLSHQGLSPRVRGNLEKKQSSRKRRRSIPASAGEPIGSHVEATRKWVYPRECGGTIWLAAAHASDVGLSPRVRGNHLRYAVQVPRKGSIPASAGEPANRQLDSIPAQVYPRECGGTADDMTAASGVEGLSPRVRGNPNPGFRRVQADGSIPASAGEPNPPSVASRSPRVYPRECGGTTQQLMLCLRHYGLSPRVRGNLQRRDEPRLYRGSIPASAGEPRPPKSASSAIGVYPRECGGTIAASVRGRR